MGIRVQGLGIGDLGFRGLGFKGLGFESLESYVSAPCRVFCCEMRYGLYSDLLKGGYTEHYLGSIVGPFKGDTSVDTRNPA